MTESEKSEVPVSFNVPPGYREEARLDVYLTEHIQNATRAKVQQGIREGRVRVNGRRITKRSHTVQAGDLIECILIREPPIEIRPEPIPLDIVFEDEDLIALRPGLLGLVDQLGAVEGPVGLGVLTAERELANFAQVDLALVV